jgi:choline-glycine betaine transporter
MPPIPVLCTINSLDEVSNRSWHLIIRDLNLNGRFTWTSQRHDGGVKEAINVLAQQIIDKLGVFYENVLDNFLVFMLAISVNLFLKVPVGNDGLDK